MSVIIGSARIDERGKASGGSAGDQTGSEVSTQTFYMHSKGWYILRAKSADVANKLATAMKEACDNNNIGYDQGQRDTLLTQFKSTKSIKKVSTKCECDCSSLVRVCIYQASGTLLSDFTTATEVSRLTSSGLFEKKSCTSSASCYNGDVLVTKTSGHTVIVCSGGKSRSSSSSSSSGSTTTNYTSTLTVDGQIGNKTVKRLQTVMGTEVDGTIDGQSSSLKKYWTAILSEACKWKGGTSQVVKAWQKYLINKGYSCGSDGADGKLGQSTAKASQRFLIAKGYSCGSAGVDGKFATYSAKALQKWLNANK